MKIIRPITINDAALTSSSVPETAPAAYNAGTTYALGNTVSVITGTVAAVYRSLQNSNTGNTPASSPLWWELIGSTYTSYSAGTTYSLDQIVINPTTHKEYQSLANSNLGNALTDATKWLELGATNRWRMFDQSNTSATTAPDEIDVTLDVTGRVDSVALLNIVAASVDVVVTVGAVEVYNETHNLVSDSGITDWYAYFFEPIVRRGDLIITNIPLYADPVVQVTLNEPGGTAECATMVVGLSRTLGNLTYGARVGIQDYSRKVADDFGNFTIVERNFSKRAVLKVVVESTAVDAINSLLSQYRATPIVFVGSVDYAATYIFGFYRDYSIEIAYLTTSYCNLEIEGLT